MLIIGITGTLGAGKGTVVDYLRTQRAFSYYSVRQFLTEEVQRRGMEPNRDSFVTVANDLRAHHSPSYIVDELYARAAQNGTNAIIESIRATGEVESLRKKGSFVLLAVDADPRTRYERIKLRGSETDHIDYDTFVANEKREFDNPDPNKQNLQACMRMADITLHNNGSLEQLHTEIDRFLGELKDDAPAHHRPSWDEYFMDLCHSVALRATCNRGRSGCVIVKDRQILVSGYVGSPSHLPHCDEVGHLFRKTLHEDGTISTHCVRTVHAEQNAICQAARRGVSLEGGTLYCTMTPCRTCAMLIINCGIKRVVADYKYHAGAESEEMFRQAGVALDYIHNEVLEYQNK
ncbi:MAG: AAA family ATPase [Bacteroidales bacterium]|nr:AAA family ATPase [Bacteroidales bacterium]MDE6630710.1 AAA family ATPase [Bacteroidales bacterium]